MVAFPKKFYRTYFYRPFLSEGPILGTGSVDRVHVASSRINSDQPTADGFVPGITLKVVRNLCQRSEASQTLTKSIFCCQQN